jgi:hypothetical protein
MGLRENDNIYKIIQDARNHSNITIRFISVVPSAIVIDVVLHTEIRT